MTKRSTISRRRFLGAVSVAAAGAASHSKSTLGAIARSLSGKRDEAAAPLTKPLGTFTYADVDLASAAHESQLHHTLEVLMSLSDDSLLKPLRKMSGQPAPGAELGGWYLYDPNYDTKRIDAGFAPACTFGQWVSASTWR